MKRSQYLLSFVLVIPMMLGVLWWAGRYHNVLASDATDVDKALSAVAFWVTPALALLGAVSLSLVAVRKETRAIWPVAEVTLLATMFVFIFGPDAMQRLLGKFDDAILFPVIYALIVLCLASLILNIVRGFRARRWARAGASFLPAIAALGLILFFNMWAIYWE